jgi:quinoprotein glucose dehydrogenase
MTRVTFAALIGIAASVAIATGQGGGTRSRPVEWPVYGGSAASDRYSPLAQIDRSNVNRLEIAWTFDSEESGGFQVNPIVVDGVLYSTTPGHRAVAIDAGNGRRLWTFDAGLQSRGPNRGVSYWTDGKSSRIFVAVDQFVYAVDAKTGAAVDSFGEAGRIDLRVGLGRDPSAQSVRLTTPGIVYQDLLILGGRVGEGAGASLGDIRAYDARTGAVRWVFHTVPRPGEAGHETWSPGSWMVNGGANNWAGMALDEKRGIVFVPTGSGAPDFYGGDRIGDNLFANCLLALDAASGRKLWHFQAVHHDIWDRDFPSPPTLVTLRRDGRIVDAVAQTTKHGYVYVLERETGRSLFPIVEQPVSPSTVPGEQAAQAQPLPTLPVPFSRQRLTADMLTTRTPAANAWAREAFARFNNGPQFTPLAVGRDTVVFPGFDGGAEWGGSAFDPESMLLFVNANDLAWTGELAPNEEGNDGRAVYLKSCANCHRDDRRGTPPQIPALVNLAGRLSPQALSTVIRQGVGRMPGFSDLSADALAALVAYLQTETDHAPDASPAAQSAASTAPAATRKPTSKYRFTGYKKFLDPDGYPATAPPWGTLNAINLATGQYAWKIPLGEYPELVKQGLKDTGTENYGGPIVTAGGIVFIGATNFDRKFRAFDKDTGRLLWERMLPFAANTTPLTYEVEGRQYVVVPAGGGKSREPSGGVFIAFALPRVP